MRGRDLLRVARLRVARVLAGPNTSEARVRSAISSAYYAAFSEAAAYAARHGFHFAPAVASHVRLWRFVRAGIADGDRQRQAERDAIADTGFRLKERRQKADYRLGSRLQRNEDATSIREAERIIHALDRISP
jgi:hypothetical protein